MHSLSLCPVLAVEVSRQGSSVPWERQGEGAEGGASRRGLWEDRGGSLPQGRAEPGCWRTQEARMREKGCPPRGASECKGSGPPLAKSPGCRQDSSAWGWGGGLVLMGPDYVLWVISSSHPFATYFPGAALCWQSRSGANCKSTAPGKCENPVCLSCL